MFRRYRRWVVADVFNATPETLADMIDRVDTHCPRNLALRSSRTSELLKLTLTDQSYALAPEILQTGPQQHIVRSPEKPVLKAPHSVSRILA